VTVTVLVGTDCVMVGVGCVVVTVTVSGLVTVLGWVGGACDVSVEVVAVGVVRVEVVRVVIVGAVRVEVRVPIAALLPPPHDESAKPASASRIAAAASPDGTLAFALHEPPGKRSESDDADREQRPDRSAALLPDEDPEHDPAHPDRGEDRAHDVDPPVARVRDVVDAPAADQHDRDDHDLTGERDSPGEEGRDEATDERADRGGDRGGRADERVRLPLHRALEIAVNQRLHRRQEERGAEAADHGPEDHDREQALRECHREGRRPHSRADRGRTRACGRSGRRSCCRRG
jgi:hypothetical protein